jgi:hypothetical protein
LLRSFSFGFGENSPVARLLSPFSVAVSEVLLAVFACFGWRGAETSRVKGASSLLFFFHLFFCADFFWGNFFKDLLALIIDCFVLFELWFFEMGFWFVIR